MNWGRLLCALGWRQPAPCGPVGGARVLDMRKLRDWGNAVEWSTPGVRVVGWLTVHPVPGDYVLSPMQSGRVGLYRVTAVKPCWDPKDMFFADVEPCGYEDGPR